MKFSELRFLRQRSWILLTLLTTALVPLFWHLSSWQFHRLHDRRAHNQAIAVAVAAPAQPLTAALTQVSANQPYGCSSSVLARCLGVADWTAVQIAGHWVPATTRYARKHWRDDVMGFWVTDTFHLETGDEVAVVRGWTPTTKSAHDNPHVAPPPAGPVEVTGWLMTSEPGSEPPLPSGQIAHVNNLSMDIRHPATPMFIIADSSRTPMTRLATRTADLYEISVPKPTDGPHHSYAWQWRAFAALVIVGWGAMVRTEIRQQRQIASSREIQSVS